MTNSGDTISTDTNTEKQDILQSDTIIAEEFKTKANEYFKGF